jgi:hypothetical protein
MNESDAGGEDDQGRREAEVMCIQVAFEGVNDRRCTDCKGYWIGDVRIAWGVEFQMTRAAERKEQEPKLVVDGVGTRKCWSEERRERTD